MGSGALGLDGGEDAAAEELERLSGLDDERVGVLGASKSVRTRLDGFDPQALDGIHVEVDDMLAITIETSERDDRLVVVGRAPDEAVPPLLRLDAGLR